jgi:Mg-chelatase subunit ChlD
MMTRALLCVWLVLGAAQCARELRLEGPFSGAGAPAGGAGAAGTPSAGAGAGAAAGSGEAGRGEAGDGGAGAGGASGAAGSAGNGTLPEYDAESLLQSSCFQHVVAAELLPANMLFVIDRSGSMACNPPPITDSATCERDAKPASPDSPSKWEITQTAVVESLKILPEASRVGVAYFSNDDACGVQANPSVEFSRNSTAQKDLIRTSLSTVMPGGATPLVGATILAYQHVHDFQRGGLLGGNSFVVLITDGKQSEACGDKGRCTTAEECTNLLIEQEVPRAAAPGVAIRTFVIGVPGSEADSRTLSRIAVAGGTARANCDPEKNCHFDVSSGGDFSAGLRQALQSIVGQSLSCDLPVPSGDLNLLNVLYKPQNLERVLVRQDTTRPCHNGANGWQYVENNTRIRLCGDICTQVKSDPGGQLAVVLGCPIQGPQ